MTSLHLCTSESWGGLELYAATLMVELQASGCGVLAVCRPGSKIDTFLRDHRIETVRLPSYSVVSPRSVAAIRSLIRQQNVEVVHVHFHRDVWSASLALRNDRTRKLFLSIYIGVDEKKDILHRFIYRRVDGIFTSSGALREKLPSVYPVPASKIHLLPYGRNIGEYRRDEMKRQQIRTKHGIAPNDLLAGTMVRIDPGKGVMDFVQSYLSIDSGVRRNVKYLVVGEPTRKAMLRSDESLYEPSCEAYLREIEAYIQRERLNDRIILTGFQSDLIGYLSAMDVFVFPSKDELYSLVVLDAMCMGLPIVAARAGGNLQQIEDGHSGLLYEVASSKDLASKLMCYIRSPELRDQRGRAARAFVEQHHDMQQAIERLRTFYTNT